MTAVVALVPFGLPVDEWGLLVLLGLGALLGAAALGWTKRVPGLEELLGGDGDCDDAPRSARAPPPTPGPRRRPRRTPR